MKIQRLCAHAITLLSLVLLSSFANAQSVVTTNGSGATEREAIKQALAEAVCRVNGASIETRSTLRREVRDVIDGIEVEFTQATQDEVDIKTASKGHIRSYDLLSSVPVASGVEVSVRSVLLKFDPANPRPGQKKTVVVDKFGIAEGAVHLENETQGEAALLSFLQDGLTTRLVRSRKFTVLTRKNMAGIFKEQGFLRDQGVAPGERVKLGALLGADYLVSGRLDYLAVQTQRSTVKLTGHQTQSKGAELRMTLTIYNVGSGAIEWEDSYTKDYSWSDAELRMDSALRDDGALARSMIELASEELGRRFLQNTFPPKVMLVDTDRPLRPVLYLNAGDSLVRTGEVFDLVRPGKELIDPDTGDRLGSVETVIGSMVVTKITPKLSQAILLEPSEALLEEINAEGFDPAKWRCLRRE